MCEAILCVCDFEYGHIIVDNKNQDSSCSRRFRIRAGRDGMGVLHWSWVVFNIVQGNADACDLTQVLWEGPEVMSLSVSNAPTYLVLTEDVSGMPVGPGKRGKAQRPT